MPKASRSRLLSKDQSNSGVELSLLEKPQQTAKDELLACTNSAEEFLALTKKGFDHFNASRKLSPKEIAQILSLHPLDDIDNLVKNILTWAPVAEAVIKARVRASLCNINLTTLTYLHKSISQRTNHTPYSSVLIITCAIGTFVAMMNLTLSTHPAYSSMIGLATGYLSLVTANFALAIPRQTTYSAVDTHTLKKPPTDNNNFVYRIHNSDPRTIFYAFAVISSLTVGLCTFMGFVSLAQTEASLNFKPMISGLITAIITAAMTLLTFRALERTGVPEAHFTSEIEQKKADYLLPPDAPLEVLDQKANPQPAFAATAIAPSTHPADTPSTAASSSRNEV